ncbi:hypothetical protein FSP39_014997 [Pinctada imbricata]|uniref:DUF1772 domain-containing protein n=1 Tax=Pinctada imbricata TaxID=66713 RepID=A0AA88Y0J6_PINIB|nr:hypothetical protein FSP39_014997 [Pinctada imbricata]
MEKLNLLTVAEWSAVGWTGFFAGGGFFINAVDIPAISAVEDTKAVRQHWKGIYLGGKRFQGTFAILGTASGLCAWYLSKSEYRWLYLLGSGLIFSVMPFTALVMHSNIKQLMEDDVVERKGTSWVREKISLWNRHHMFRTLASTIAFDSFILGVFLTR